ncbi:MAG: ABC transporter permease subunit [Lachnospiraceae bacterium]|nr:ABC transporter permease subunit [Lachnospiraceae bacterium]MBP3505246.1 ABC transporter permease subunit [Lachnospiraceae bacterium]
MWNVIRAQLYQLKKDKISWGAIFLALAMSVILAFLYADEYKSGSEIVAGMAFFYAMIGMIVMLIVVTGIMGKDFTDKTLNYEILAGHTRGEVFLGRLLVAALVGSLVGFLVMVVVPCAATLFLGWGDVMAWQGVVIRYGLVWVTLVSICVQLAFVTILTKNPYITLLVGYLVGCGQMMIRTLGQEFPDLASVGESPLLSINHCMNLLTFDDWYTFFLDETEQIIYNSAVEPQLIVTTIGTCLVTIVLLTIFGYVFFKHDDLN